LEEALVAQRLVAIENGRLVFDGPPNRLLREKHLIERLGLELPAIAELGERLARNGLAEAGKIITLEHVLELLTVSKSRADNNVAWNCGDESGRDKQTG
jgi:hypothetical protein